MNSDENTMVGTLDVKMHALGPGSSAMVGNATRWLGAHCDGGAFVWDGDGSPLDDGFTSYAGGGRRMPCGEGDCLVVDASVQTQAPGERVNGSNGSK
jgi:hypothetical protein